MEDDNDVNLIKQSLKKKPSKNENEMQYVDSEDILEEFKDDIAFDEKNDDKFTNFKK